MAGLYKEVWTGELVKRMDAAVEASFLNLIPSYDRYVQSSRNGENQVIHLVDVGAVPEVLINNITYPIGYQELPDGDIPFSLDKYQTKATPVTEDELRYVTYDKIGEVNRAHKSAILATKYAKAVHALAPLEHTAKTPVLLSSGKAVNGRKRVSFEDIIDLGEAFGAAGVPNDGKRILVLSPEHLSDLLKEDKDLYKSYVNTKAGTLQSLFYGFNVYTYTEMPSYTLATKTKTAFGQIPTSAETKASIAFYAPDMFRAQGTTKLYHDKPDTQHQRHAINYRHYYLVSPKKYRAIGALLSAKV